MSRNVNRTVTAVDGAGRSYTSQREYIRSSDSPRIGGKLHLVALAYSKQHHFTTKVEAPDGSPAVSSYGDCNFNTVIPISTVACDNKATSRFYSQLRKGRASLGVTAASWQQSSAMIQDRLHKTASVFDGSYAKARRHGKGRYSSRSLANDVLEGEFGWLPLIQDIHAAATTMFGQAVPPVHVTGRAKDTIYQTIGDDKGNPAITRILSGRRTCTVDAMVYVSNPNLWALNRMGLINPAVVAWDLVPWSFLVNFFVNVPAVLGQFTDTIGLSVKNISTTRSYRVLAESSARYADPAKPRSSINCNYHRIERQVGTIPTIKFEARVPDVSWETTLIAASLLVQKVRRFQNLFHI